MSDGYLIQIRKKFLRRNFDADVINSADGFSTAVKFCKKNTFKQFF